MVVGKLGHAAPARGPRQKTDLHQIGFVDVLQRDGLLPDRSGERFQTDRAAAVVLNDGAEHPVVDAIEPQFVMTPS